MEKPIAAILWEHGRDGSAKRAAERVFAWLAEQYEECRRIYGDMEEVANGAIGEIVSAILHVMAADREPEKTGLTDMEYMLRNWLISLALRRPHHRTVYT